MIKLVYIFLLQADAIGIVSKVTSNGEYALAALLVGSWTVIGFLWRKLGKKEDELQKMTEKVLEVTTTLIQQRVEVVKLNDKLTKIIAWIEAEVIKFGKT